MYVHILLPLENKWLLGNQTSPSSPTVDFTPAYTDSIGMYNAQGPSRALSIRRKLITGKPFSGSIRVYYYSSTLFLHFVRNGLYPSTPSLTSPAPLPTPPRRSHFCSFTIHTRTYTLYKTYMYNNIKYEMFKARARVLLHTIIFSIFHCIESRLYYTYYKCIYFFPFVNYVFRFHCWPCPVCTS